MKTARITEHLSKTTALIQDLRSGEQLFVFADDCRGGELPEIGIEVSYMRDGIDMATDVRELTALDKIA